MSLFLYSEITTHSAGNMDENRLPRPKYLWEANVEVAEKVKETVRQNIHEETNLPFISSRLTRCTMQLPARSDLPRGFDPQWQDVLFDRHVQMELEQARVVNWCRSIKTLLPLSVPGQYSMVNVCCQG